MNINRRSFIASLLATAVMDPERLLWVPGAKTIFVPPPRQVLALDFASPEWNTDMIYWQGYVIYNGETQRIIASGSLNDAGDVGEGRYTISLSASQLT